MAALLRASPSAAAHRVVSLLPAATEIVCLIGAEHLLVGRGHEDDFPPTVTSLPVVTHSKSVFTTSAETDALVSQSLQNGESLFHLHDDLIRKLRPSVIITQTLCSVCAIDSGEVYRLSKQLNPPPTIVDLSPTCLQDVINDVIKVGNAIGLESEAKRVADGLFSRVKTAQSKVKQFPKQKLPSVVFLEWTEPLFCGGHWTPELIEMAGGVHPLNQTKNGSGAGESFRVTSQQIAEINPDWIIVCPCGLNLNLTKKELDHVAKQEWWQNLPAVQQGKVAIVDGNTMFNRSGPRLVDALEWLVGLLNDFPQMMPKDFPFEFLTRQKQNSASNDNPIMKNKDQEIPSLKSNINSYQKNDLDNEYENIDNNNNNKHLIGGEWHPVVLNVEIEEAHLSSQQKNETMYIDPSTGFSVLTENYLLRRGNCCGNRCRHCPYGHFSVNWKNQNQTNTFHKSRFLTSQVRNIDMKNKVYNLVFWNGDFNSFFLLKKLRNSAVSFKPSYPSSSSTSNSNPPQSESHFQENTSRSGFKGNSFLDAIVSVNHKFSLTTFFEADSGRILSLSKNEIAKNGLLPVCIRAVMKQAKILNVPLLAVAVKNAKTWKESEKELFSAINLIPGKVQNFIFSQSAEQFFEPKNEFYEKNNIRLVSVTLSDIIEENASHLFPGLSEENIVFHHGNLNKEAAKPISTCPISFDSEFFKSHSSTISEWDWNFVELQ